MFDQGLSSIGATLAICLTDGLKSQRLPLKPNGLDFLIEAGQRVDETDLASALDLTSRELPEKSAAMSSIQGIKPPRKLGSTTASCSKADGVSPAYFSNVNTFFPIIDEDLFMCRAEMFYNIDRPRLSVVDYCLFYLSVSIGALNEKRGSRQPEAVSRLATTSYRQAWDLVQGSFASPRESSVQILLLHVRSSDVQRTPSLAADLFYVGLVSYLFWNSRYGLGVLRPGHSYCAIAGITSEKPTRHGFPSTPDLSSLATLGYRVPF